MLASDPQQLRKAVTGRNTKYGKRQALRDSENHSVNVLIKTDTQEIPLDPILLPRCPLTSGDSGAGWILQPPVPSSLQEQFVSSSLSH